MLLLLFNAQACWWSRVFYSTRHHGNCARGKGGPHKAQPDCCQHSPPVAVTAAAAAVSLAAFRFPSLVAGNDLNLVERWGRGRLQDRWPMCPRALALACAENWENKLISNCKGNRSDRSRLSEEPERLDWLFIAIQLNSEESELSFSSDQKTNTWVTWQYKFTIRNGM